MNKVEKLSKENDVSFTCVFNLRIFDCCKARSSSSEHHLFITRPSWKGILVEPADHVTVWVWCIPSSHCVEDIVDGDSRLNAIWPRFINFRSLMKGPFRFSLDQCFIRSLLSIIKISVPSSNNNVNLNKMKMIKWELKSLNLPACCHLIFCRNHNHENHV